MRTESQRAQPRVDYATEVHILRPGGRTPIRARSLNLSPTGVFLEAEHRATNDCPVGTHLLCDIPLPGGRRYLKGRVARLQSMSSAATGLGICFENLEAADQAILQALVQNGSDNSRLVKVRFEGMPEALRSRAIVTKDGLRLQTALPFLRIDSSVDVSFIAGDSRVETHGTLESVQLEPQPSDGIPRLAVDVTLSESAVPYANEFLSEGAPRTGEFGPEQTTAHAVRPSGILNVQPASPFDPSPSAPTLVLHTNEAGSSTTQDPDATFEPPARASRRRQPLRIRERRPAPAAQTPAPSRLGEEDSDPLEILSPLLDLNAEPLRHDRRRSSNPWWWTWGWPVLGGVLVGAIIYDRVMVTQRIDAHLFKQTQMLVSARNDLSETRSLAKQAKGAAEATQAVSLGLRGVIHREISVALNPPRHANAVAVAPGPQAPQIRVIGPTATAAVAITGSTEDMIQYSLKDPAGVVVKLPQAQAALPAGHYKRREGGFSAIWVDQKSDGLTIRFIYDQTKPQQEMLEVIEAGPDLQAPSGSPEATGSVRVRLRQR